MPVNTILLISLGRNGGLPKYARAIALALAAGGEPVRVLEARGSEHPVAGACAVPTYRDMPTLLLSSLTVLPLLLAWLAWMALARGVRVFYFPYVHTWTPVIALLGRLLGRRVVVTFHDYRPHLGEDGRLVRRILGLSARLASAHVFLTRHVMAQAVADGVAVPERSAVIPHGLFDLPGLQEKAPDALRPRLCNLLFVGRISPYKGVEDLMAAYAASPALHEATLVIAGKANYGVQAPACPGRIELVDRYLTEQEMATLINAADLMVLPYREATQSGIVTLAIASGTPLVVTDIDGFREQLGPEEALFCAPGAESLRAALAATADVALRRRLCAALLDKKRSLGWDVLATRVRAICLDGGPA